jgi:hypothetical protein
MEPWMTEVYHYDNYDIRVDARVRAPSKAILATITRHGGEAIAGSGDDVSDTDIDENGVHRAVRSK